MSSTNPPPEPTVEQRRQMTDSYATFIHNTSLTMLLLAPVLIAIPPRKLDLYTFTLVGAFAVSANQLTRERTGRGILANMPFAGSGLPQRAEEVREKFRAEKKRQRLLEEPMSSRFSEGDNEGSRRAPSKLEAAAKELWMGGEKEGWKERRLKEEQEKISQGEGYGSMIMDQIWEVWNWGEKKGEELEKGDREVVAEKEKK